jgi:hypothetical protein
MESFDYPYETFSKFLDIKPYFYNKAIDNVVKRDDFKIYIFRKFNENFLCIKLKYINNYFFLYCLIEDEEDLFLKLEFKYKNFNYYDFFSLRSEEEIRNFFPEINHVKEIYFCFTDESDFFKNIESLIYIKDNELFVFRIGERSNLIFYFFSICKNEIKIIHNTKTPKFFNLDIGEKFVSDIYTCIHFVSETENDFSFICDFSNHFYDRNEFERLYGVIENEKRRVEALCEFLKTNNKYMNICFKFSFSKKDLSLLSNMRKPNISENLKFRIINYGDFSYLTHSINKINKMIPLFEFNDRYIHRYPKKFREWYFKLICIFKNERKELSSYNLPNQIILHISYFIVPSI